MSDVTFAQDTAKFMRLFHGYPAAYGTGDGGWVHKAPGPTQFVAHLRGQGSGIGIGPLMPDGNVWFGAIDLDRPDFHQAREFMALLPGVSWLERSRSGNAHVHVFFDRPIKAWVVRGILRETLAACGERMVEVFPKSDFLHPGMVGNYINLPYHGDSRPIIDAHDSERKFIIGKSGFLMAPDWSEKGATLALNYFVDEADANRNSATAWEKRAHWLSIPSPEERDASRSQTFGESPQLHRCASYIIEHRDDNAITEGHRAAVYFALACQLSNWSEIDHDEALSMMALVNEASPDPIPSAELGRILSNAERGQFTSTRCDDPLVLPYSDPECPIAKGMK